MSTGSFVRSGGSAFFTLAGAWRFLARGEIADDEGAEVAFWAMMMSPA
jgi:hypothetical protein